MAKKDKEEAPEKEEPKEEKAADPKEGAEGAEGEGGEGAEGGEGGGAKLTKKRIILAGAAVVLLLVISLGAAFFGGMIGGHKEPKETEKAKVSTPGVTYYDLGEFLVNLNTTGKQVSFLKMKVTVELPDEETKAMVEAKLPRIKDTFQVYLRELRASDLQGSAGLQRLREELVLRLNKILHPLKVSDVLFSEIIVQ